MEVERVSVCGKECVLVGVGVVERVLPTELKKVTSASKYVVLTDTNVAGLPHLQTLLAALRKAGVSDASVLVKAIPPGEFSKSRSTKAAIEDWMLEQGCNRDTCVIALGGGVVGDLSGYVAATFMRGVGFIQVPTTLLAMVDSSVGGKTGINAPAGKNLIGAFYQPSRVFIDPSFLSTLPQREISNGMAEVIKTFAFHDEKLFRLLEDEDNPKLVLNPGSPQGQAVLQKFVVESVRIKAEIVTLDEKESSGIRMLLNFGHTIGHAIEGLREGTMLHGECVAIGLVKEAEIACALNHLQYSNVLRLTHCIKDYRLPTAIPAELSVEDMMKKMEVDKKNMGGKKKCVLIKAIGAVVDTKALDVDDKLIRLVIAPSVMVVPKGKISGSIHVPGSKSISNRVLLLAAMGKGECKVRGLLNSDDTEVMMDALKKLKAATFEWLDTQTLVVRGTGGDKPLSPPTESVYLGNAGTAARFLTSLCTLVEGTVHITGNERMRERPIADLVEALCACQNCKITYMEKDGCLPLKIDGTGLPGGEIRLSAAVSSQFVSSILLSAPFSKAPVTLILDKSKSIVSQPYIDMTVNVARMFGVTINCREDNQYYIPVQRYNNPPEFDVESDASSATYPLAIAAITGGKVTVKSLGVHSVQGDSKFYKVLEAMGCAVQQTELDTIVEGPSDGRLKSVNWNMGDMTDAFMTVAVLAAVAEGTSTITGIANQRVKECNRIAVMVEELTKCGVSVKELEDGLEIHGTTPQSLHGASIECHNDHRIAMSFAVLGCAVPGIIILDKACTQKTYPEFWFDVMNSLNVQLQPPTAAAASAARRVFGSIVIIGMRGAGKTHQGRAAAAGLGWQYIDIDHVVEKEVGQTIKSFVIEKGWEVFRKKELEVFKQVVETHTEKTVIGCGGGIVETEAAKKVLETLPVVVYLNRDIQDISQYLLTLDSSRPTFNQTPEEVFKRRLPLYKHCSTHEFVITKGDQNWTLIERDFVRFIRAVVNGTHFSLNPEVAQHFPTRLPTFFLSLTFPNLKDVVSNIEQLSGGVNALEVRVDLLESYDLDFIKSQIALLRRSTHLPLIFTVRSKQQGGQFPDNEKQIFQLLLEGLRLGCEYIDMESCWSTDARQQLINSKGKSKVIGSYHYYAPDCTSPVVLKRLFHQCWHAGQVDVVKVVVKATSTNDNFVLATTAQDMREVMTNTPIIAVCTSEAGKLSRVVNEFMTPVTHPQLPMVAAPGQLSVQAINTLRAQLGMCPTRQFFLFGKPISASPSPLLHNTAFTTVGLPHKYSLFETEDANAAISKLREESSGGGSVTIPLKQAILPLVDHLTNAATQIGAVNTVVRAGSKLIGDNTDWIGIMVPIQQKLAQRDHPSGKEVRGLVVGAGGTSHAACYALKQMGVTPLIWNRTASKAEELAKAFGGVHAPSLDTLPPLDVIVSALPPAAQQEMTFPAALFSNRPIVMDVVYRPRATPILKAAKQSGCQTVEGIDMLFEQGCHQFERWSGLCAPRKEMADAVVHTFKQNEPF